MQLGAVFGNTCKWEAKGKQGTPGGATANPKWNEMATAWRGLLYKRR